MTGLAPVRERLANGLTLLVKDVRTQPAVSISAAVAVGSAADPAGQEGTAHLLSRLLDRGAGRQSADDIAALLDLRGVSPVIGVTRHATTVTCDCLAEDVEAVLGLVCDMVRSPTCPDDEVRVRRGQLVTQLKQDEDNTATQAVEKAMGLLYGELHPYGRRPKGSIATVEQIGRTELLEFHAARFTPAQVTLVLAGDIRVSEAVSAVTTACGDWSSSAAFQGLALPPPPPPAGSRRRRVIPMPAKAQADIVYGFTTITRADPAYHAYWVMNNVLGQYGIGGRLGRSIRERQGMAYYAGSVFEASHIPGPLLVRAGVNADNVDRALASIDAEVETLARDGVTDDELTNAKRYLTGSMPRSLETNAGIARFLQNAEQFDLGLEYDQELPRLIASVTRDQVADAARQTLVTDKATVVIAGPYDESS